MKIINKYMELLKKGFMFGSSLGTKTALWIVGNLNKIIICGNVIFDIFAMIFIIFLYKREWQLIEIILIIHIFLVVIDSFVFKIKKIKNSDF